MRNCLDCQKKAIDLAIKPDLKNPNIMKHKGRPPKAHLLKVNKY